MFKNGDETSMLARPVCAFPSLVVPSHESAANPHTLLLFFLIGLRIMLH